MVPKTLDAVERTMLKALQRNDRASLSEVAAMLPSESEDRLEAARAKLERAHLVEPVPGSATSQMQLTWQGAEIANDIADTDDTAGSGGGSSTFA